MGKVVVLKVEEYNLDYLKQKLEEVIDKYFPADEVFSSQDKILLKPNLLIPASPENAVTTHPVFIEAVGKIFKERGFKVYIADNPSAFRSEERIRFLYRQTGVEEIASRDGFELLYPRKVTVKNGIPFSWWTEGFAMVNLPKLKTHNLTVISCAAKNLYGCISGIYKSEVHKRYPTTRQLVKFLLELNSIIKPSFHIVDGILGLEGEGPSLTGKPRPLGVVVMGRNPFYVDYAVSRIINLSWENNPLLKEAGEQGFLDLSNVEIIEEDGRVEFNDFKFPPVYFLNYFPPFILRTLGRLFFKLRPKIMSDKCKGCGACWEICPAQAIDKVDGKAKIDYSRCILCMCCNEVCSFQAVEVEKSWLLRHHKE